VQSRVGNNLWQVIQFLEFSFGFLSEVFLYVLLETSKFDLFQDFCVKFCKDNDSLVN
jgi:hypothetical protein